MPLSEGQLLEMSLTDLREMSTEPLLQRLHELGYNTEQITTKTQALTRLMENVYDVHDGEE